MHFFETEKKSALQAKEDAQRLAFAPFAFQTGRVLRDSGILKILQESGSIGLTLSEVVEKSQLSHYATRVLLEGGLGIGLAHFKNEKFSLSKMGFFLLNDESTIANMNFTHDVCYKGLYDLDKAIETGKPEGLKVFGSWPTIYEALSELPEPAKTSWFNFDHFYSDESFTEALSFVFKNKPKNLLDIGGNTGKFTIRCLEYDEDVKITIVDLPGQLNIAKAAIENKDKSDRVTLCPLNILDESSKLPKEFDAIWMSQFLDCFSDDEILSILKRCYESLNPDGKVYILEPFWDKQRFESAAYSLQMTSIYFTAMANGNSQMYYSPIFFKLIDQAGLMVEMQINQLGICNTLLQCKRK